MAALPVLVTGANGLIGTRVIEYLRAENIPVLGTDLTDPSLGVPFVQADLADPSSIVALFNNRIGSAIHCGAISGPMIGQNDPSGTIAINVGGTVSLVEQFRQRRLGRFVHCSSIAAYGATGLGPVKASEPLLATDIYGASKAAADILVHAYAKSHQLDAYILRIGWVYGPRRRTRSLLHRLIRNALDGQKTIIEHDGTYAIQLIHVDDVARGLISAWKAGSFRNRTFNLTSGTRYAMKDLASMVKAILPQADYEFTEGIAYPDVFQDLFSIEETKAALSWSPKVPLDAGIRDYVNWLRNHPH
jgi:nucleoside-diphosphate-sugar epimerase